MGLNGQAARPGLNQHKSRIPKSSKPVMTFGLFHRKCDPSYGQTINNCITIIIRTPQCDDAHHSAINMNHSAAALWQHYQGDATHIRHVLVDTTPPRQQSTIGCRHTAMQQPNISATIITLRPLVDRGTMLNASCHPT